jgi:anthranilate synthase component 2
MLLLIDNYDSFTFNLYQYLTELGARVEVHRNDKISVEECLSMAPEQLVLSPGPCTPSEAGISTDLVGAFAGQTPVLGVCLGLQCIGAAYGATISYAGEIMHGKTSLISHDGEGVFAGLPEDFEAVRYHSLAIEADTVPEELIVTATSDSGVIMGVRHRELAVEGVQFHPESIFTNVGHDVLRNFLAFSADGATSEAAQP